GGEGHVIVARAAVTGNVRVTRRTRPVAARGSVSGGGASRGSVSRGPVSRTGRVPSGAAVPGVPRARRRVGRIARRHGAARPDGAAGSHAAGARGIVGGRSRTRPAGP